MPGGTRPIGTGCASFNNKSGGSREPREEGLELGDDALVVLAVAARRCPGRTRCPRLTHAAARCQLSPRPKRRRRAAGRELQRPELEEEPAHARQPGPAQPDDHRRRPAFFLLKQPIKEPAARSSSESTMPAQWRPAIAGRPGRLVTACAAGSTGWWRLIYASNSTLGAGPASRTRCNTARGRRRRRRARGRPAAARGPLAGRPLRGDEREAARSAVRAPFVPRARFACCPTFPADFLPRGACSCARSGCVFGSIKHLLQSLVSRAVCGRVYDGTSSKMQLQCRRARPTHCRIAHFDDARAVA